MSDNENSGMDGDPFAELAPEEEGGNAAVDYSRPDESTEQAGEEVGGPPVLFEQVSEEAAKQSLAIIASAQLVSEAADAIEVFATKYLVRALMMADESGFVRQGMDGSVSIWGDGVKQVGSFFRFDSRPVSAVQEPKDPKPGQSYKWTVTVDAWSSLFGKRGTYSGVAHSTESYTRGRRGAPEGKVEDSVRQAAQTRAETRAFQAICFKSVRPDVLRQAGINPDKIRVVEYAEGPAKEREMASEQQKITEEIRRMNKELGGGKPEESQLGGFPDRKGDGLVLKPLEVVASTADQQTGKFLWLERTLQRVEKAHGLFKAGQLEAGTGYREWLKAELEEVLQAKKAAMAKKVPPQAPTPEEVPPE